MQYAWEFVKNTLVGGLLIVVPLYLAVLLLLKGMQSVMSLVRPLAQLLPPDSPRTISSRCSWWVVYLSAADNSIGPRIR